MHLRGVRPAGEWNLFARFCRLMAGCRVGRRGARFARRADLNVSGQNDHVVGATISGDTVIKNVILIVPIFSFPVTGPETGPCWRGKCTEIIGLSGTATKRSTNQSLAD